MKKTFSFLISVSCVFIFSQTAYSADKLEPIIKDRGKHFQTEGEVIPVREDGIRDPSNDAVGVFQQPVEAMSKFPRDAVGNVDWSEAMRQGMIAPRADQFGESEKKTLDLDIIFKDTGSMPNVRFSHMPHTQWLDCSNCHPKIFAQKQGGNDISMTDVFTGKYCGLCHGKVAFPVTNNCMRCHSEPMK